MNRRYYSFDYNLPADNHISGKPDVFIPASAEWNKGAYYPQSGRPIIISEGPVIEKLNKHLLTVVKDWQKVYLEIERIAQDYFLDQYHVEQKVKVIIHDEISY